MRFPAPAGVRRHALVLTLALVAVGGGTSADLASADAGGPGSGATVAAAKSKKKSSCRVVKTALRRHGKVVRRHGRVVRQTVRICPKKRCTLAKLKKRKHGRVVRRHGKVIYVKAWKCKPRTRAEGAPTPGSGTPSGPSGASPVPPQRRGVRPCTQTVSSIAAMQSAVASASAGTVVCLADGTYGKLSLSGAKPGEVVAQPATSNGVTIAGANVGGSNLTLEGFKVAGLVSIQAGSSHATVQFNRISGGGTGVFAGSSSAVTQDVTIRGNKFVGNYGEDAIRLDRYHDSADADPYGALVEGNEITGVFEDGNHNDCLQTVWQGDHLYIRRNYVHGNNCQGFFVKDQDSAIDTVVVEDNLLVDHTLPCQPTSLCPSWVLTPMQLWGPITHVVIRSNTFWTPYRDGQIWLRGNGLQDVQVDHNVIYHANSDATISGLTESSNTSCRWDLPKPSSSSSTDVCSPPFPNSGAGDYRLPGGRGVTWAAADQQYGP
jgi:hypothetical protein